MKTIDDALELRGRIFGAFEMAELESDPAVRDRWMTFVVVGAGPTGVEMAGQIAELAHRTLPAHYRRITSCEAGSSCSTPRTHASAYGAGLSIGPAASTSSAVEVGWG